MTPQARVAAAKPLAAAILPPGATALERALLTAELAAQADLAVEVILTIWDPMACPPSLLPWLAWALSVDVWDESWTIERKRKVISAAPMVHRLKGTRGAVRRALDAFDLESRIVEWFEDAPVGRRGTFRIEMIYRADGPAFDPVTQAQAIQAVRAAKPKSRVFGTMAVLLADGPLFAAAVPRAQLGWTVQPYAWSGQTAAGPLYAAATPVALMTWTVTPRA
ncbi:phage tail protein I [Aurantimonas sp. MSK8Z-1]|uniref:phage tail protein I n=1 Tax=Mangrovibrevibacter kandeliae TaxID=2968473 RepID=UPI00211821BC|nr:phage tail protein I [Aurantimonas sp. MSK8Z-1]MCW4114739.1 phage tail protein I [Aurantimonas sp. MSK8Z-1]